MNSKINKSNVFYYLPVMAGFVLIVLSLLYANERIIYFDNSLLLIDMLEKKEIQPMVYRFGAMPIRFLPFIAWKLGASLQTLIYLFSLSYALYYFILILVVQFRFKNFYLALLIGLLNLVFSKHNFFWSNNELIQATSFNILIIAYLLYKPKINYIVFTLLAVASVFYHPQSALVLIGFLIALLPQKNIKELFILFAIVVALFIYKKLYWNNWYDEMKMEVLVNNLKTYSFHFWQIASWSFYKGTKIISWLLVFLFSSYGFFTLIKSNRKGIIATVLLVIFVCFNIVLFHYQNNETLSNMYAEPTMMALVAILVLPFFLYTLPQKNQNSFDLIFFVIFAFGTFQIIHASKKYTARLDEIKKLNQKYTHQKTLIPYNTMLNHSNLLQDNWALAHETMLLSALNKKTKTICTYYNINEYEQNLQDSTLIINGLGHTYKYDFAPKYFNFSKGLYFIEK